MIKITLAFLLLVSPTFANEDIIEEQEEIIIELTERLEESNNELERLISQIEEDQEEIESLRQANREKREQIDNDQAEINNLREQISNLRDFADDVRYFSAGMEVSYPLGASLDFGARIPNFPLGVRTRAGAQLDREGEIRFSVGAGLNYNF